MDSPDTGIRITEYPVVRLLKTGKYKI